MGKIYFSSDLHFGHDKDFLYEPRGFKSIEENDEVILNNFNQIITDEDDLYILGDLMLNDNESGMQKLSALKGKIHIILGNHDTASRVELYKTLPNVVEITYATIIKYKKLHIYLSHYPTFCNNLDYDKPFHQTLVNFYGHTHQQTNFFDNNPYMYHVGVDSHSCCPIDIDTALEECRKQKTELNNQKMKEGE